MLVAKKLTPQDFFPYGTYSPPGVPETEPVAGDEEGLIRFWDDYDGTINLGHKANNQIAKGVCVTKYRPLFITTMERHLFTEESILPDGDVYLALHRPTAGSGLPIDDDYEVFLVPRGYEIKLKAGVWHHAPHNKTEGAIVLSKIILPPGTYNTDCQCFKFGLPIPFSPPQE